MVTIREVSKVFSLITTTTTTHRQLSHTSDPPTVDIHTSPSVGLIIVPLCFMISYLYHLLQIFQGI